MTTPTTAKHPTPICDCADHYSGGLHIPDCPVLREILTARATIARLEGELSDATNAMVKARRIAEGNRGDAMLFRAWLDMDMERGGSGLLNKVHARARAAEKALQVERTRADAAERRVEAVTGVVNAARLYVEARVAVDWAKTEREIAQTAKGLTNKGDAIASAHKSLCEKCNARDTALSELIASVRALAAASGDTAITPDVCSECHGDGYITVAVCCGNGHNGECCYDPEPSQEPCPKCSTATTEG